MDVPVAPGPNPRPPIVVTDRLSRRFGELEAVPDLSLQVERGQIFGFLGPNGAGKTTTIKMLCGLLPATSGQASVAGYDIEREREQIKRQTGYMAQTFSLYPDLTVEENSRFFGGAYGVYGQAATRRMDDALRSGGARGPPPGTGRPPVRRHEAATGPRLCPGARTTAGLPRRAHRRRRPANRQRLWDFLYALCEGGTSLFITTHYLDEAERCHAVGFMLEGRLIGHGEPRVLREQLRDRLVGVEVRRAVDAMRALRMLPGVQDVTIHGHELRVRFDRRVDWRAMEGPLREAAARAGVPLEQVYPLDPTLEDLFLSYERQHSRRA